MYKQRLLTPQVAGPYEGMLRVVGYQSGPTSNVNAETLLCFLTVLQDLPHILDQHNVEWKNGIGEDAKIVRVEQGWTLYVPSDSERAVKRAETLLKAFWHEHKPRTFDTVQEVIAQFPLDMELEGIDPTPLPNYQTQFRDFPELEFKPEELPIPFFDVSWCQDLCPSFHTRFDDGEEQVGDLKLFIDYPNKEDRESEDYPRFGVYYCLGDYDTYNLLYCETPEELKDFLEKYKANPEQYKPQ